MGYGAHKAWAVGTASASPTELALTKVTETICVSEMTLIEFVARRNTLHDSAGSESDLDATVFRLSQTNRSHC